MLDPNKILTTEEILKRLEEYNRIIEKFGSFERAMAAENVVHCSECAFYDPENLLCDRYGLEKPAIMLGEGYCSCGFNRDTFNKMMEDCRARGGWCTPGVIMSADEVKRVLEKEE